MAYVPCSNADLQVNLVPDCNNPRVKGYEKAGVLIRKSEIASFTANSTSNRIIEALTLKALKKTYVVENSRKNPLPFNGTQTTYNREQDAYDKMVQFYYEGIGGLSSEAIEGLKNDDFVLLLERKDKRGDGSFHIFGWENGLSAGNENGAQVQDEATGYWLVTMTTQERFAEYSFFITDYETTKTAYDLLVAESV